MHGTGDVLGDLLKIAAMNKAQIEKLLEHWQMVQQKNPPSSGEWQDASKRIHELAEIQRLVTDALKNPFGKPDYKFVNLEEVSALFKRQIERLGCTDVKIAATLNHDAIDIEARFTPPPSPIVISFTVEPKE
jgi:hypothetical protein